MIKTSFYPAHNLQPNAFAYSYYLYSYRRNLQSTLPSLDTFFKGVTTVCVEINSYSLAPTKPSRLESATQSIFPYPSTIVLEGSLCIVPVIA